MEQNDIEREFSRLQHDREFTINILAKLALELVHPQRKTSKELIEASISVAAETLQGIDKNSLAVANHIDNKFIMNLLHG
ncbi:MAG TPA: hypothetical protein DEO70_12030 [Bacteroidales bacterium]|nr:MAG: hypothetical protein A2X11_10020 [Bacteroidetes bacterium GWE2_42_24]OFY25848.1 MAG: hypothetical protein A2X09_09395 [Bacteroidetes bacterium GWF2_43_11]HBZ67556.1 hypothetical protein [Bacteroidales bacterium]